MKSQHVYSDWRDAGFALQLTTKECACGYSHTNSQLMKVETAAYWENGAREIVRRFTPIHNVTILDPSSLITYEGPTEYVGACHYCVDLSSAKPFELFLEKITKEALEEDRARRSEEARLRLHSTKKKTEKVRKSVEELLGL